MKKIAFLLLLLPMLSFSQAPAKGSNTIIVKGVRFDRLVNALLDSGYKIDKIDREFHTIKTEYKKFCLDCFPEVSFDIRMKDSVIYISGTWRNLTNKRDAIGFAVDNDGYHTPLRSFIMMDTFAHSLSGSITYARL